MGRMGGEGLQRERGWAPVSRPPPLFAKAYVKVGATIYFKQLNLFNILQQISKSIRGYLQNFLTQRKGTSLLPNPIQCSNINTNMYRSNN